MHRADQRDNFSYLCLYTVETFILLTIFSRSYFYYEEHMCVMTTAPNGTRPCACTFDMVWDGNAQSHVLQTIDICASHEVKLSEYCLNGHVGYAFKCCIQLSTGQMNFSERWACNNPNIGYFHILLIFGAFLFGLCGLVHSIRVAN